MNPATMVPIFFMAGGASQHRPPPEDPPTKHIYATAPPHTRNHVETPRRCMLMVLRVILITCIICAIVYQVYTPDDPKFRVVSAAVNQFNTSSPPFVSAAVNFTVEARNPNKLVSIFYGPLSAIVSYGVVPIMQPVILPPFSQGPKSTVTLSPELGGAPVPVEETVSEALAAEAAYGMVGLRLELAGKLRYKRGALKSMRHAVEVECDLELILKRGLEGQLPCEVTVF